MKIVNNFLKIFSSVFQFRRVFIKIGDIVPVEAGGAQTAIADGAKFIDGQKAQRVGIYITAKLIHLPSTMLRMADNFMRTPRSRSCWVGWMKVRAT